MHFEVSNLLNALSGTAITCYFSFLFPGIGHAARHLPFAKHVRIVYNEFEVSPADSMNLDKDLEQVLEMEMARKSVATSLDPAFQITLDINGMNLLFVIQVC